ncbi:MAG: DUF3945 domain-containing protein [Bacteroides sp.]|nr:DUF3945 domain-containing protein [Bacteroides sp.]
MDENKVKDQNILLVKEKGSDELKAVASIDAKGKVELVDATGENAPKFLAFDRNDKRELADLMSNYVKEKSNTDNFQLFQVRAGKFEKQKEGLEEVLSLPNHPEAKNALKPYAVNPQDVIVKQTVEDFKVLMTQGEDGKLKAVSGMEKDGKLNTVDPTKENADNFFQINPNGNLLENFMQKFSGQYQHPSHTGLYAVAGSAVDKISAFLDKIIKVNPDDKVLDPYRVKPEGQMQEQTPGKYQPLDLNKVDWKDAEKLGLSGEQLQNTLKAMAYSHKSPGLVDIKSEIDGKEISVKARLSLQEQPDGSIKIQTHPFQEKPDFDKPYMGVKFTQDDIANFKQTGNGGRVFDLEPIPGGEKVPSLVSLDKLTNRFESMAVADLNISATIKNAPLSQKQQDALKRGEGVLVKGMDKRVEAGEAPSKIDRILQYNVANRNFDFRFTPEQQQQYRQERQAKQEQSGEDKPLKARKVGDIWIRPIQGGVELTRDQFKQLCEGKPIWVEGMQKSQPKPKEGAAQQVEATDKKGQKYPAWVWPDPEKGHVRHTTKHPDQVRAIEAKQAAKDGQKVTPAEGHKTQVAVNNDGKTNEATKHAQGKGEALKSGQTHPTAKQDEKKKEQQQKQSPAVPKKSTGKGRKM